MSDMRYFVFCDFIKISYFQFAVHRPTPIGHKEDITLRALRVLKESDVILADGYTH